jgi:hypothetical protein
MPMPRRAFGAIVLAVSVLSARGALAQGPPSDDHAPNGTMIGLSVGLPGYESRAASELLVLGLNILHARPSTPGIEFSLGTIPRLLSGRAVVLGGRLDAIVPIVVTRDFWLTPAAGGSMVGGASSDGGGAFAGVNAGIGAILWSGRLGLRSNVTWHHFVDARGVLWLVELGFVEGR